jgi:hypothetical protein
MLKHEKHEGAALSVVDLPESYKDALADVTGTFRAGFQSWTLDKSGEPFRNQVFQLQFEH